MSSHENYANANHIFPMIKQLYYQGSLSGIEYSNTTLANQELLQSGHDPNALVRQDSITAAWPGGSPAGNSYETAALHSTSEVLNPKEEALFVRRALLGATVDTAALDRIPRELKTLWQNTEWRVKPVSPITYVEHRASERRAPLCVAMASTIMHNRFGSKGERMVHLWYPLDISPVPILNRLKKFVLEAVAEHPDGLDP